MNKVAMIQAPGVSPPGGHYSHGVAHNGVLYISGQLGCASGMTAEEAGDIEVQTRRALATIEAIVRAAGGDRSRIVKVNVYLSDLSLWPAMNAAYAAFFGNHRPARAAIPTGPLHHGALVEIDAVAAIG
jgi:2-iminobutanoate/2-iminopropanoate deaminase